jgi:hypothetical protein
VFASVYSKLRETGAFPSRHISSERANEEHVDEVEKVESILQLIDVVQQQAQEEFLHVSVFHVQE